MILGSLPIQGRNAYFDETCSNEPLFSHFDSCVRQAAEICQFQIEDEFHEPYKYGESIVDVGHYREYTYTIYGEVGFKPGNGGNGGPGAKGGKPGVFMIEGLTSDGPYLSNGIETSASKGRYY